MSANGEDDLAGLPGEAGEVLEEAGWMVGIRFVRVYVAT